MAKSKKDKGRAEIDDKKAHEEGATREELRGINEAKGDGGNPQWWKNEGGHHGEVQ